MSDHSQPRWCALQVYSIHESAMASRLHTFGIRSFLPKCRARRKSAASAEMPQVMYLGYLICLLELLTTPKLYKISGVSRIPGSHRRPTPIEDEEIRRLKILVDAGVPAELHPLQETKAEQSSTPFGMGPLAGSHVSVIQPDQRC
jgi:hypothetical protein